MKVLARRWRFIFLLLFVNNCSSVAVWTDGEVPFVPTPVEVVDRMLKVARIKPGDVVYDVGSGDGAIIIRAAKKFGVKGVGPIGHKMNLLAIRFQECDHFREKSMMAPLRRAK
ncbi:MAG: hypothetical protein GEU77_12875 [Deltaproteobacteria bacterium]|nr:hypothetical protein [Deltaproteobacteria bacterium]